MSADNGIYIAKFPDGYRVAYEAGIDNVDYFPVGSNKRKRHLRITFGKSKVFSTKELAYEEAKKMEKDFIKDGHYLEYGVCYIGEYEDFKTK